MRIERIVITGDILRTFKGEPNQLPNVRWLHEELRDVLEDLTGLSPRIGYRRNMEDDGLAIVADWYGLLGHTPSLEGWAATYALPAPPAFVDALAPDYERALVIGFELSPILRSALDRLGAPWIDVETSPIRFLEDLAFTLRCSWLVHAPANSAATDAHRHPGLVAPSHVEQAVADLRARYRDNPAAAACNGACIFLAQTRYDRTLLKEGGLFPDSEVVERMGEMLRGRRLVLKPHPLQLDNPLIATLRERFAAPVTDANIYALLAAARDVHFVTISSSAAIEACHFGQRADMLHPAAHADAVSFTSLWAHRSATFWRAVLGPLLPLKAGATYEERLVPDRLRRRLSAWGFTRTPTSATHAAGVLEHV